MGFSDILLHLRLRRRLKVLWWETHSGGEFGAHSLGEASVNDGMELVGLSTRYTEEGVLGKGGFGEVVLA
jgi:hypothetical protein